MSYPISTPQEGRMMLSDNLAIPADVLPEEYTEAYTATVRAGLLQFIGPLIDVLAHGHGVITLEIADHQVQRVRAEKSYKPRKARE